MKNSSRLRTALLALLLCTAAVATTLAQSSAKLRVTNPQRAQELVGRGARVIADYGSFQLLEAPTALAAETAGRGDVASADEMNVIQLNAARLDTTTPTVKAMRGARAPFWGRRLHLVQFAGPIKPEWRDELEKRGARVVTHIPNNAYLIYGDSAALARVQSWAGAAAHVQWDGDYVDGYKIHPRAKSTDAKGQLRAIGTDAFAIQLVEDDEANVATLAVIGQYQLAPVRSDYKLIGYRTIIVQLPASQIATIAAQPDVVSIQPCFKHRKFDERQDQIMAGNLTGSAPTGPGYLSWLAGKGFTQAQFDASGFVVDVSDSGVDNGTTSPGHFALYRQGDPGGTSRVVYNRLEGTPNGGSTIAGCDGHGNLNSHIIGGYAAVPTNSTHSDSAGFLYGLGVCPFVKVGSSVIFDPDTFTDPIYANLQSEAYNDGARVSGNSWGASVAGDYNTDSQAYDALVRDAQPAGSTFATAGNQQMVIVFAAGNDGPGTGTVGSPGTAKNLITVGAAENVRAFGGSDGSGVSDAGANSANDIIDFSSRGPCADGRYKPDLVAPGTHVTGGVAQDGSPTTNGTGSALACYDASGVSGGVGHASFFPPGQQFYSASSGTSHSTPGIAGACALLRQYFINASLTPPSPAMTKAFLVNSARYMTGTYANDTLPSQSQGMGHVNLGTAFDGAARVLRDQTTEDTFTASGQSRRFTCVVPDNAKPLRVTLAWTDAPGSTTGAAYNNNLDLTVTVGGTTYKGNIFSGANSTAGGVADAKNNVESVFLPAGATGVFTVMVTATDINSDGVPNEGTATDQDFALVVYNAAETNAAVVRGASYSITNESCTTANGVLDPGETATVSFALENIGSANAANAIATLLATGGVTSPSGAQAYGALTTNGSAVSMPFTFTANGICGSNIQATLVLTDGATNLGTVTFTLPLGLQAASWSENFDGSSAPALPVGWSTTSGGAQSAWVTTTTASDSAPNAAYSTDASSVGSNALTSVAVTLPSSPAQLTFRHRYNLEPGFDGGVLELKIGADTFKDILTNGGSFASGGYTTTLETGSGGPLAGRQAWSGDNGAFATVVVNLPASAAGQSVQFRWRCATDESVSDAGWWIDSVAVTAPACCGDVALPSIITPPQSTSVPASSPANFTVVAAGSAPLNYQWYFNSNVLSSATATNYFIASVDATNVGAYHVIVTNAYGSVTSSVAMLTLATPPVIVTNPASQTIFAGGTANFSVAVTGSAPFAYQWRFNSTNIPGATTNTYSLPGVTTNNAGNYLVIITNIAGAVTSAPAMLTVTNPPPGATFAGILAGWDMSGQTNYGVSPMAPTTNAPNVTVVGLTRGPGVTVINMAAARAWGGNGFGSTNAALAITAGDYATFSITANAGYAISFTNVSTFAYRRSGSGPPFGLLQYQIGSGAFMDITNVVYTSTAGSGDTLGVIDLSAVSALQFVGEGTNVNFRLVNYGTNLTGGNWYLYDTAVSSAPDFAISGSVVSLTPPAPPAVAPVITNAAYTNGQFQFQLTGTTGSNYVVLTTTNLTDTNWISIWTNPAPFTFVETNATNFPLRFYRGRVQP